MSLETSLPIGYAPSDGQKALASDLYSQSCDAIVELFELDITPIDPAGGIFRFHSGTNELMQPVVWQGNVYTPMPIKATGFELNAGGQSPRPKLTIANLRFGDLVGLMTAANQQYDDLVGAKVTRRRTLVKYLDAANFTNGNELADPTAEFPLDVYYVDQRVGEHNTFAEYQLSSLDDVQGIKLPLRQVIADICSFGYREYDASLPGNYKFSHTNPNRLIDCPYMGGLDSVYGEPFYKEDGSTTTNAAEDCCGRRLSDCRLRFRVGQMTREVVIKPHALHQISPNDPSTTETRTISYVDGIPFGGFPGAGKLGQ